MTSYNAYRYARHFKCLGTLHSEYCTFLEDVNDILEKGRTDVETLWQLFTMVRIARSRKVYTKLEFKDTLLRAIADRTLQLDSRGYVYVPLENPN